MNIWQKSWRWFVALGWPDKVFIGAGFVALCCIWQFWFLKLPGPIQTGLLYVLAAGIAFLAAYIGVREHARREQVAREVEMQRQVYFRMASAMARMREYLSKITIPSYSDEALEALITDFNPVAGEFHIVSDMRGIECLNRFTEKVAEIILDLAFERALLMSLNRTADDIRKWIHDATEKMKQSPPTLLPHETPEQFQVRTGSAWNEFFRMDLIARWRVGKQTVKMMRMVAKLSNELVPLEAEAVLAARGAFGFELDPQKYCMEMTASWERMSKHMASYADKIQAHWDAAAKEHGLEENPVPESGGQ